MNLKKNLTAVLLTGVLMAGTCFGTAGTAFAANTATAATNTNTAVDTRPFNEKNDQPESGTDALGNIVSGVQKVLEPVAEPASDVLGNIPVPARSKDDSQPKSGVALYGLLQWDGKDGAAPFKELKVSKVQNKLPKHVYFRDNNGGFNREFEVCLYNGNLYIRHRNVDEKWRVAPVPKALKGHIAAISVDADEIMALDENNWIYTMVGLFDDTDQWTWSRNWGEVFDIGTGYQVINGENGQWSLSNIDPDYDLTYTDIDGRLHDVGGAGCTQIFMKDPEDPTKIYFLDPWLPADESREIGTPYHSRFKVQSFSSSASMTFVINKYGDMFTRLFDYDLSGSDEVFFEYSWFSQVNVKDATENSWSERLTSAKIRLPSPSWEQQPKIDGTITDRISVESTAQGSQNRRLKVEGKRKGHTGYFTKLVNDKTWKFVRTDEPLQGTVLQNSTKDTSKKDLAPKSGLHYKGTVKGTSAAGNYKATITVKDFAYNDHEQDARITVGDVTIPAKLYNEYGNLGHATTQVITWRPTGFGDALRRYTCALVLTKANYEKLATTEEGRAFLEGFMSGKRIRPLSLQANVHGLFFADDKQWTSFVRIGAFDLLRQP